MCCLQERADPDSSLGRKKKPETFINVLSGLPQLGLVILRGQFPLSFTVPGTDQGGARLTRIEYVSEEELLNRWRKQVGAAK